MLNDAKAQINQQKKELRLQKLNLQKSQYKVLRRNLSFNVDRDPVNQILECYREMGIKNAENNIEFRWVKNQYHQYQQKIHIQGRKVFAVGNDIVIVTSVAIRKMTYAKNIYKPTQNTEIKLKGKNLYPKNASLSPNGKFLAITATDLSLKYLLVYDIKTLKLLSVHTDLHESPSPFFFDNNTIIVGSQDNIQVFQFANQRLHPTFTRNHISRSKVFKNKIAMVTSYTRINDHQFFYTYAGRIIKFDLSNKKIFHNTTSKYLISCCFQTSKHKLLLGTESGNIVYLKSQQKLHPNYHSRVRKIHTEQRKIFSCNQSKIFIHDHNNEFLRKISVHKNVQDFAVHNNKLIVATGRYIAIHDINKQNPLVLHKSFHADKINFSPTSFFAFNSINATTSYNFDLNKQKGSFKIYKPSYLFRHPRNGNQLSIKNHLYLMHNDKVLFDKRFFRCGVYEFNKDLHYLCDYSGNLLTWSWSLQKFISERNFCKTSKTVQYMSLSHDNKYLVILTYYKNKGSWLHIMDTTSWQTKLIKTNHLLTPKSQIRVTYIQNQYRLLLSIRDEIFLWYLEELFKNGHTQPEKIKNNKQIQCFDVAQNGQRLIVIDNDKIVIWSIENHDVIKNKVLMEFTVRSRIEDCKYFPKYHKLVTVGEDVMIWNFD